MTPDIEFSDAPQYQLFVVPGGPGIDEAIVDQEIVGFVRSQCRKADMVFGICTGSLLLGAAGLLVNRSASCHWQAIDFLSAFGAKPTYQRTTRDGNYFTSGGVTAGIDMALELIAEAVDQDTAEKIQLILEYDPKPPFTSGHPDVAPVEVLENLRIQSVKRMKWRQSQVLEAAKQL